MSTAAPESVDAVRKFAVNSEIGDMMLSMIKDLGEGDEEDLASSDEMVDKHLAATIARAITNFGP